MWSRELVDELHKAVCREGTVRYVGHDKRDEIERLGTAAHVRRCRCTVSCCNPVERAEVCIRTFWLRSADNPALFSTISFFSSETATPSSSAAFSTAASVTCTRVVVRPTGFESVIARVAFRRSSERSALSSSCPLGENI